MPSVLMLTGNMTRSVVEQVWGPSARRVNDAHELRDLVSQANEVTVVLGDDLAGFPALNVASALHLQNPQCTILLVVQKVSQDLNDRARKAGVTRVYDLRELQNRLLAHHVPPRTLASASSRAATPYFKQELYAQSSVANNRFQGDRNTQDFAPSRDLRSANQHAGGQAGHGGHGGQAPSRKLSCSCIAVLSAQGGVGKSTVAAALSAACTSQISAHKPSRRQGVSLLDLDAQFPVIPSFIGLTPERGLDSLLNLRKDPAAYLDHAFAGILPGLSYAVGAVRPEYADKVWAHTPDLLAESSLHSQLLVVNLPKVWNECSASTVERADMILMVCRECAGDLATLKQGLALLQRLRIERTKIVVVINKSQRKRRDQTFVNRIKASVGAYPVLVVNDGGSDVDRLAQEGLLLNIFKTENRFASSIVDLSRQLTQTLGLSGERRLQTHVFA